MPTALRLLTLVAMLTLASPVAADVLRACTPDDSALDFFTPAPWTPDAPNFNLATACVGEPYSQVVTIVPPPEVTLFGQTLDVSQLLLPSFKEGGGQEDKIKNLPAGLRYNVHPANGVFEWGHQSCVVIYGTPTGDFDPPPKTFDLTFEFGVVTPFSAVPLPADYPGFLDPDAHVYLNLEEAGQCPEPNATVAGVAVLGALAALSQRSRKGPAHGRRSAAGCKSV
jgi:hypothetical protein